MVARLPRAVAALLAVRAVLPFPATGQSRGVVEQERREFAAWLEDAPLSPRRAVVVRPIGPGLSVGPDAADIPLAGVQRGRLIEQNGRVVLEQGAEVTPLARGRPVTLGEWQLLASGPPGRGAVTVFAAELRPGKPANWFAYDPALAIAVVLTAPAKAATQRVLGADGVEVEATDAGTVAFRLGGTTHRLRVLRMPGASDEESELEIYFTDQTNGKGSYPSGRFVGLIPRGAGGYLLDLNRARSPFCAHNTVFPCPAPWRGNALPLRVNAGERYRGTS